VFDPLDGETRKLRPDRPVRFARADPRAVDCRATTRGWRLEPLRVEIDGASPDLAEIRAYPDHSFVLEVFDEGTRAPVEHVQVRTAWLNAAMVGAETPKMDLDSPGGELFLQGLPIESGRFRVEVSTPEHYVARSEWFDALAGEVQVIRLGLKARSTYSARLRVSAAERAGGAPVAGIRIYLFQEVEGAPITGILAGKAWVVLRDAPIDRDLVEDIPPRLSDEAGVAVFEVPAPARYRVAIGDDRSPCQLGGGIALEPGDLGELDVLIDAPASLRGILMEPRTTASSNALAGDLSVMLKGEETQRWIDLQPDRSFAFDPLAPGSYHLSIHRKADVFGNTASPPVLTKELALQPGEHASITLDVDTSAELGVVRGTLVDPFASGASSQMIGIARSLEDDPGAAPGGPFAVTELRADGSFELGGIPNGKWLVVAAGRTEDRRETSLMWAEVEMTDAVQQPPTLTLEAQGEALVLYGEAMTPPGQTEARVEVAGLSPMLGEIVASLPPVVVVSGAASRVIGLPAGDVTVNHDDLSVPLGTSRSATLAFE
jgi:hypothetical protein